MPLSLDPDIIAAKNALAGTDPWIWLIAFTLTGSESLYVATGNETISYSGKSWLPFPITVGDFVTNEAGDLPDVTLAVGDPTGILAGLIDSNPAIDFSTVTLHRYVSGAVAKVAETYYFTVERIIVTRDGVTLTLGNLSPVAQAMFPSRRLYRATCTLQYKGDLCGYAGALETCDFTLRAPNGCVAHENQSRFGGVPGAV